MYKILPNIGYIEKKLSKEDLNKLKSYIKNKRKKVNHTLAGNINSSYDIKDKNNSFYNNTIVPTIVEYMKLLNKSASQAIPKTLTKNCSFVLSSFWVNFQKKHEFNPIHNHSGVFSFVIWINIPVDFKKESKLPFVNHSNSPLTNCFQFSYTNVLGQVITHTYKLNSSYEGTMLFFPSKLNHVVYPFYSSNKNRISISGNIYLDPEKIIKEKNVISKK